MSQINIPYYEGKLHQVGDEIVPQDRVVVYQSTVCDLRKPIQFNPQASAIPNGTTFPIFTGIQVADGFPHINLFEATNAAWNLCQLNVLRHVYTTRRGFPEIAVYATAVKGVYLSQLAPVDLLRLTYEACKVAEVDFPVYRARNAPAVPKETKLAMNALDKDPRNARDAAGRSVVDVIARPS